MKKVYVGEPWFVINKDTVGDDWFNFCDIVDSNNGEIIYYKNYKMFVMKTNNSDGVYELKDKLGNVVCDLSIETGLLCIFDTYSVKDENLDLSYGFVLDIEEFDDKNIYLSDDSEILHIGDYFCNTSCYAESYKEDADIVND